MLTVPSIPPADPASFAPGGSQQQSAQSQGTGTIVAGPERIWDLSRPISLDGIVTHQDPATGQMSVQTAIGMLTLSTDALLAQGATLSLRITPGSPPVAAFFAQSNPTQVALLPPEETPAYLMQAGLPSDSALIAATLQAGQIVTIAKVLGRSAQPDPSMNAPDGSDSPQTANAAAAPAGPNAASPGPAPPTASAPSGSPQTSPGLSQPQNPVQDAPSAIPQNGAAAGASATGQLLVSGAPIPAANQQTILSQTGGRPNPYAAFAIVASGKTDNTASSGAVAALRAGSAIAGLAPDEIVALDPHAAVPSIAKAADPTASSRPNPAGAFGQTIPTAPAIVTTGAPAPTVAPRYDVTGLSSALAAQMPPEEDRPATHSVSEAAGLLNESDPADHFSARIIAILPPGSPPTPPISGLITATVGGTTFSGHPILETDEGGLVVEQVASLPPGTTLLIQRVETRPSAGIAQNTIQPSPLDPVAGKSWPALAAALPVLTQLDPAIAEAVRMAIPQAGALLAPVMLLFVAALRRGDARAWLGDGPLAALRRAGQPGLADSIGADFERAARQSTVAADDGWHTMPIPLFAEGELTRVQLHLRRYPPTDDGSDDSDGNEGRSGGEVRFLIDAEPSATGPLQLDGLVRRAAGGRKAALDLIVRSYRPIPPETRSDIALIFAESLATSGLGGGIAFQGGADWIKVAGERAYSPSLMA